MKLLDIAKSQQKKGPVVTGKLEKAMDAYPMEEHIETAIAVLNGEISSAVAGKVLLLDQAYLNSYIVKVMREGVRTGGITINRSSKPRK